MTTNTRYFITDLVEEVGSLPHLAAQIVAATSDPDCDLNHLSRIIRSDSVMTMRFLALANSAALSRGQEIRNLQTCLVRLGLRRVRNVALLMGMYDMAPADMEVGGLALSAFWKHTLATASCAQGLAWIQGGAHCEDAWLVGILQGIGVPILARRARPEFAAAVRNSRERGTPLLREEIDLLEFHHGELGARILRQWNLPEIFAEAVEFSLEDYDRGEVSAEAETLVHLLRSARRIVRAIGFGDDGDGSPPPDLESAAAAAQLEEAALESVAAKIDREVGEMSQLLGMDLPGNPFQEAFADSKRQAARLGLQGFDEALARAGLEEQLTVAREIQQRLLPGCMPELPGFDLAADNRPSLQVSGDYYDVLHLRDGSAALVIADVAGKGLAASLLASSLQASLRALARTTDNPGDLLRQVNAALFESTDDERFATLFLAVLSPDGDVLRYASAGHNPPLLLTAAGQANWLRAAGTPLGLFPEAAYTVGEVPLQPGDLLVAYTDGITEAIDPAGREFAATGLEAVVREAAGATAAGLIDRVLERVRRHVHGAAADVPAGRLDRPADTTRPEVMGDDLTLVILKRTA